MAFFVFLNARTLGTSNRFDLPVPGVTTMEEKKMKRKLLSILLTLMLVTGLFGGLPLTTITAYAVPGQFFTAGGDGTAGNPYQITTAEELRTLAAAVNAGISPYADAGVNYKLMNDLDLSAYGAGNVSFNDGKGWIPIGHIDNYFYGNFDGNGKTIDGLYINNTASITPGYSRTGLFGWVQGGTIQNLGIVNADISAYESVGAVAGYVHSGTVKGCYSTGVVSGSRYVGGLTGSVYGGTVTGSYSACSILGGESRIGGVTGCVESGSVQNCYATGAVSGNNQVGGVAGLVELYGSVLNCYATGAVSAVGDCGGIAGKVSFNGTVAQCAALNVSIRAYDYTNGSSDGRILGSHEKNSIYSGNIAYSGMTVIEGHAGGALDIRNKPLVEGADQVDGLSKSKDEINADGTLFGLFPNNGNPWTTENGKLPGFGAATDVPSHLLKLPGSGTQSDPYQISTAAELASLAELVNTNTAPYTNDGTNNSIYYILMDDIDLSAYGPDNKSFNGGKGWIPIGNQDSDVYYYSGHFDGNGKTISGLYINSMDNYYTGLFGRLLYGTVKDLSVADANIVGRYYVGGVVGYLAGGTVQNCQFTGTVSGTDMVGAVAGNIRARAATVQNCYSAGSVSGITQVGGVVGYADGGVVQACLTTCSVSAGSSGGVRSVGGLVGYIGPQTTLRNCAALNPSVTESVINANSIGRIVGNNNGGSLSGNIAFSGMEVKVAGSVKSISEGDAGIDGVSKTGGDLRSIAGFPSAIVTTPWTYEAERLPGLFGAAVDMPAYLLPSADPNFPSGRGNGTADYPYQITTEAELAYLANRVNSDDSRYKAAHFLLKRDLDLSKNYDTGNNGFNNGNGWIPIGNNAFPFKGVFDGGGHVISGVKISQISQSGYEPTGLFGCIEDAAVINLGAENVDITGSSQQGRLGGIAGLATNSKIENCYATGAISGNMQVGGVVGAMYESSVRNCYAFVYVRGGNSVSNNSFGGIAGFLQSSSVIENCYALGAVEGYRLVGGIAGNLASGTIRDCLALNRLVSASNNSVNDVARIATVQSGATYVLSGNAAFVGTEVKTAGMEGSSYKACVSDADGVDGENRKLSALLTAAGYPAAFRSAPWTYAEGALPGLFGKTVSAPDYFANSVEAIDIPNIGGVTPPVYSETPKASVTETEQFTGSIQWSPAVSATFAANTVYTATITLTPKPGYSADVAANFFTVTGATATNAAKSGVITAVFPATGTPDSAKAITGFTLAGQTAAIDEGAGTIAVTVPYGTNITNIAPAITHTGASVNPADGTPKNFTNPVTYTVTAADDTQMQYVVTVTVAPNSAKVITDFTLAGQAATINEGAGTIAVTVPYGTDITSIAPVITHTGASVDPADNVAQDFTSPVVYTVTAANGTTKNYTVTVSVASSTAKAITGFTLAGQTGTIDEAAGTIRVTVPDGTAITSIAPAITYTGAGIDPAIGVPQDFLGPVVYTVTAANGTTKNYTVTVTVTSAPPATPGDKTPPVPVTISGTDDTPPVPASIRVAVPPKTSVTKAIAGKKQLKVTWKKVSAAQKITKYELRYKVKGTSKWKKKTVSAKSASLTIKKLIKGKTYQVQVRSYKTVNKVKYYSAWSKAKTSGKIR
jgi:hypothetical protein